MEEEEHVVLFTMHHIVSDGWSMGILSREVGALYQAYSAGEESPLEELPIQYADFAVWQREWLQGRGAGAGAGVLAEAVGGNGRRWSCRRIIRGRRCRVIEGRDSVLWWRES